MYFWQITLSLVTLFVIVLWRQKHKKMAQIPAPPCSLFFGHMLQLMTTPENLWTVFQDWNKKYYPIYQIHNLFFGSVELLSPDDIEILLTSKENMEKSRIYEFLHVWLGTGLLTSKGDKWHYRRKLITPAFHFGILQQFSKVMIEKGDRMVQRLKEESNIKGTIIEPFVGDFTLQTICETAMGTRLDEDNKRTREYVASIYRMGQLTLERINRPWLLIKFIYYFSKCKKEEKHLIKLLHNFTMDVIESRKNDFQDFDILKRDSYEAKKRLALLDLLLSMKKDGANIDDEGIREEVDTFTFEGHDTTSSGIQFALYLLSTHPNIQEKVAREIQEVTENSDRQFTFTDVQNMKYLEMVIKESLRLYPSVPIIARKLTCDMKTASNYTIPANKIVHIHIYGLHRNPMFYPDPEKFDPERFSAENSCGRHPFAYIPFSAGPRNCIGQRFALLELKIAVASIVRNFRLTPVDNKTELKLMMHLVLKSSKRISIKFEKRV